MKIAQALPLEAQEGGAEITGRAFHRASLNHELAMRDGKIQGLKLATAPFLSPDISYSLMFFAIRFVTKELAEKNAD